MVLFGLYVPAPPVQVALVADPPIVPASVADEPAQIDCAVPAFAVAVGFIVITTEELAAGQGPAGSLVVNVNVTEPLFTSVPVGVYVAFNVVLLGEKLPAPPLHVPLVADPPTDPARVTVEPAQIVCGGPALAVAVGLMVITTEETVAGHGPAGSLVVNVNVREPLLTSVAVGVYTAFKVVLSGEKLPAPLHVPLVADPPIDPARVAGEPAQIVWAGPALAVAEGLMVIITEEVVAGQGPAGSLVVNINVTEPLLISVEFGVYTAFKVVLFGEKVPAPPLHVPLVADPPTDPESVTVEPAQIVCGEPASTVAEGLMVITTVEITAGQGPVGSLVVNVNVAEPLLTSVAVGVYTAFKVVLFGEKVPDPLHVPLVADPPTDPARFTVELAQIVWPPPALEVAAGSITTVVVPEGLVQLLTVIVTE